MSFPTIDFPFQRAAELASFKELDRKAVETLGLPIELMMENAGLHLATLVSKFSTSSDTIKIGIGNGNNGGGGLVAARRLAAWGYKVILDPFVEITKNLPAKQLKRALKFGAVVRNTDSFDIWVDAYLGFSQRLPLSIALMERIRLAKSFDGLKISLDLPTGFLGNPAGDHFIPDKILTLAAAKKILYHLPREIEIYLADLGIPRTLYAEFHLVYPPFAGQSILHIQRQQEQ